MLPLLLAVCAILRWNSDGYLRNRPTENGAERTQLMMQMVAHGIDQLAKRAIMNLGPSPSFRPDIRFSTMAVYCRSIQGANDCFLNLDWGNSSSKDVAWIDRSPEVWQETRVWLASEWENIYSVGISVISLLEWRRSAGVPRMTRRPVASLY